MFEKEAEEYARRNNPAEYGVRATHFTVLNSFKDGAEFGYNKGYHDAEEHYMNVIDSQHKLVEESKANEWHDLRKDPKDLPNGYRVVLNQVGMATEYDPTRGFLGFGGIGVIAWREIPIFEKG
jgi:hypothetical protein